MTSLVNLPGVPGSRLVHEPEPGLAAPVANPLPGLVSVGRLGVSGLSPVAFAGAEAPGAAPSGTRLGTVACAAVLGLAAGASSDVAKLMAHSEPYNSNIVALHKALSCVLVVATPSAAALGRRPGPDLHGCQAFHFIRGGCGTSPSLIACTRDFVLRLTCCCVVISGFTSVVLSRSSPQLRW